MPAPSDVIDNVVAVTVDRHSRRQSQVAYASSFLFFVNAGLNDADMERWIAAYLPWQQVAIREAAERGWTYASLLWALQTDNAPEGLAEALEKSPLVADIQRRAERFADSPVRRARWEAAQVRDAQQAATVAKPFEAPKVDVNVRPEVARAAQAAREARLLTPPAAKKSTFAISMEKGAAQAAEQAMADTNQAFGAGMDRFASTGAKKMVKRWLKAPHPNACRTCFLVAGRGYRSAQAAMRAGHLTCRCSARVEFVPASDRYGNVSNVDWRNELESRGYGLLYGADQLSAEGRAAVAGELFPGVSATSVPLDLNGRR